jgi:hypothetical protein
MIPGAFFEHLSQTGQKRQSFSPSPQSSQHLIYRRVQVYEVHAPIARVPGTRGAAVSKAAS